VSAALLDHLWQSTLFSICAWMLTWVLRKNGAHLRHVVWSVASLKFLIPFSLLTLLGQAMQPYVGLEDAHVFAALGAGEVHTLLGAPGRALAVEPTPVFWRIAAVIWLIGLLMFLARWFIRWRRVREILDKAEPVAIAAPVPVRMSAGLREPGVIGIVRPVLLLPTGITTRLTPPQLDAILRHELCHLRRHDNLTSAIHMLVEAVFWFHPFVWWIGARML
jgi:beta-lactamase regulating signal transducer with metallopeptidase domain